MNAKNRTLFYIIWMAPIWFYISIFLFRMLFSSSQVWTSLGVTTFGIILAVIVVFGILGLLIKIAPFQLLLGIVGILVSCVIYVLFYVTNYSLFEIPILLAVVEVILSGYAIYDSLKFKRWRHLFDEFRGIFKDPVPNDLNLKRNENPTTKISKQNNSKYNILKHRRHQAQEKATISIVILILLGSMTPFLISSVFRPEGSRTFTITNAQAENYDLVVYFPDYGVIDTTVCDIFVEANATLSFPLTENNFAEGDPNGELAADKVQLLNSYDIKVEVWPLFEWEEGSYPSLAEMDRWEILYEKFDNWTTRNGITVEYLLWDIEGMGEGLGEQEWQDWLVPFNYLGQYAAQCQYIQQIQETWEEGLETIHNISQRCDTDGHIMRTTTHTIIWDLFDGDSDTQKQMGLPVWDATDDFEYISMMAYRGCEWGGEPATSDMMYEVIRASKLTQPGTIAVCLGCINFTPYPDIPSVKSDVLLSLAAGANSIRLFQANSWINGVGEWMGSGGMVYGGPAHGLDGESGLRQLLQACRTGGSVIYTPTTGMRTSIFTSVLLDVLYDLSKL